MKKNRRIFCMVTFLFFISVFSGVSFAASNTQSGPIVSNFEGDVSVKPASSDNWEPIKELGLKLKNGSTVRTEHGTAEISCPDGSIFKFERNTIATLSIDKDGRVQINATKGSVNAILGKSAIATQIGPDQILQERYNPKTLETDISCVNGASTLTMPDGTKVALTKGDVVTSSPKERAVKVQAGTAEVTKGAKTKSLDAGFKFVTPRNKPFYVRQFPVAPGRYRTMADPFATSDEYAYTEEYYSQQEEASPTEESIEDTEEISEQEEPIEDAEPAEEQSLQQDDDKSAPEQAMQEAEDNYSDDASGAGSDNDAGGDSGGDDGGGDSGGE